MIKNILDEDWIPGIEYLEDVDKEVLDSLKKRGYKISAIYDGLQVWIENPDTEAYVGFGESVEEAIDSALPLEIRKVLYDEQDLLRGR